jgi:DNA-3-methyladenine glycosylase I
MAYCDVIQSMAGDKVNLHKNYHDNFYGYSIHDDNELFGRLILEINQAGLSWDTILKKEKTFRVAYDNFDIFMIAHYNEKDIARLLADPGIIRNRLKINAAITNARAILILQKEYGTLQNWLLQNHPKTKDEWVRLFKSTFKFTGGEIVNEFLMSTGYLSGAHSKHCPIYKKVLESKPMWLKGA